MMKSRITNALVLTALSLICATLCFRAGLTLPQSFIVLVFCVSILGSLFFWNLRLGFVFIGSAVYLGMGAVTPEEFILYASLDVILFLISMMIIVGMMKDAGLFEWIIVRLLCIRRLSATKLFLVIMMLSAVFSSLMGEVASIMIMVMTVITISDLLEVDPVPLVIASVIATNIGSASTILGNPVGILIAARSGLSFEDFLVHALPIAFLNLLIIVGALLVFLRKYIAELSRSLKGFMDEGFLKLINIPIDHKTRISIWIFAVTIVLIALHKRLELLLGLHENTLLMMFPILSAGIVLMYRHERAREYIEKEIEWPSIIFFMFLFAQAGVIRATGIAELLAKKMIGFAGASEGTLSGIVLISSGVISSLLDNVVAVAAYIPLLLELQEIGTVNGSLWWALLFGACFGGNITMIGSTANIVALGLLEKHLNIKVVFMQWIGIGTIMGLLSLAITWGALWLRLL